MIAACFWASGWVQDADDGERKAGMGIMLFLLVVLLALVCLLVQEIMGSGDGSGSV